VWQIQLPKHGQKQHGWLQFFNCWAPVCVHQEHAHSSQAVAPSHSQQHAPNPPEQIVLLSRLLAAVHGTLAHISSSSSNNGV
jgi:hypothetical protein